MDTGVFDDDRYFDVFVEYAKVDSEDLLARITVVNRGPEPRAAAPPADDLVPQHLVVERRRADVPACGGRSGTAGTSGVVARARGARRTLAVLSRARPRCSSPRTTRTHERLFGVERRAATSRTASTMPS